MRAIVAPFLALALLMPFSLPALALDDTPQNREAQADRYLEAIPPQGLIDNLLDQTADALPTADQDQFKALVAKHLNRAAIATAIRAAMVKIFSADELKALADFYGSPLGKSAMAKMPGYQNELGTALMSELQPAVVAAEKEARESAAVPPEEKTPPEEKK
jgi:hypothetical protein